MASERYQISVAADQSGVRTHAVDAIFSHLQAGNRQIISELDAHGGQKGGELAREQVTVAGFVAW